MLCKELESVLAGDDLRPLSSEAQEHLAGCRACRDLLADLSAIVAAAKHIPAEVNPPERLWVALRAQLEAEGIIREAAEVQKVPARTWWPGFEQFFRPRVLATVAAALLVAAVSIYLVQRPGQQTKNPTPIANGVKPNPTEVVKTVEPVPAPAPPVTAPKRRESGSQSARVSAPPQPRPSNGELAPSPSENAYLGDSAAVLSQTESALPSQRLAGNAMVDAALRQNLRTLNEFIAECETRLKQNPQDPLTREYLNMAYQQKAELLTAMLDSGRSEH